MSNITTNFKLLFLGIPCFSIALLSLTKKASTESKVKQLIFKKEQKSGSHVREISLDNFMEPTNSLFTVNYSVIKTDGRNYKQSIKISRTQDNILSEFN